MRTAGCRFIVADFIILLVVFCMVVGVFEKSTVSVTYIGPGVVVFSHNRDTTAHLRHT